MIEPETCQRFWFCPLLTKTYYYILLCRDFLLRKKLRKKHLNFPNKYPTSNEPAKLSINFSAKIVKILMGIKCIKKSIPPRTSCDMNVRGLFLVLEVVTL